MKRILVLVFAAVALLAAVLGASPVVWAGPVSGLPSWASSALPAADPDLAAIYRQFIDALNRGEAAGAAAFVTDDVEQVSGGLCPCQGKAALSRQFQASVAGHIAVKIVDAQGSGPVLTTREEVMTDGI